MSTAARSAAARPASSRPSTRAKAAPRTAPRRRASLTEVPAAAPAVAGNGVFAGVVVAMLLGGMAVLLGLNTSLAQGAFDISGLTRTQNALAVQEQTLVQQVALEESPESLQHRADELGMVPVNAPVFLRLADGKILGTPVPATVAARVRATATLPKTGATTAATTGIDAATSSGPVTTGTTTGKSTTTGTATTTQATARSSDAARPDAPARTTTTTTTTTTAGGHA